jgi:ferredoxin
MRIVIDRERCSGHAVCVMHGPDVFVLDDLGYNVTDDNVVPEHLEEQAQRGALAGPEVAISIVDDSDPGPPAV